MLMQPSLSFALRAAQLYCHYGCCKLGENLSKPIIAAFQRLLRIENYHVYSVRRQEEWVVPNSQTTNKSNALKVLKAN